jgi:tetratricopeptide (TPR) repeat protein
MGIDEKSLLKEIEARRKVLKKDPASKEFLPLAEALRKLKRYNEAIEVCKAGIEKNPKYITGYVALVKILLEAGKIENALEEAERGLKIAPDNTTLLRLKGEAELKLGKKEVALQTLERCYELSPDEPGLESLINTLREEVYKGGREAEEPEEKKIEEVKKEVFEDQTPSMSEVIEEKAEKIEVEEEVMEEPRPVEEIEEMEPFGQIAKEEVEIQPVEEPPELEAKKEEVYEEIPSPLQREPPVVIKEIKKKKFDVQEAIGFAVIMEKEGNLKSALQLWIDVLKHDPSNIEAKRKIAELRKKMWKEKEVKKESKDISTENLKLLARWIKKIKEGG